MLKTIVSILNFLIPMEAPCILGKKHSYWIVRIDRQAGNGSQRQDEAGRRIGMQTGLGRQVSVT